MTAIDRRHDAQGTHGIAAGSLPALDPIARAMTMVSAAAPSISSWIDSTLAAHAPSAEEVHRLGFANLPAYFPEDVLRHAKVVVTPEVPLPPYDALGLGQFSGIMPRHAAGITYKDTFFVRGGYEHDESLHFHELVHVVQWEILGSRKFIELYARGLLEKGYRDSPLEVMAYDLQERFDRGGPPFDARAEIEAGLKRLLAG